MSLQMTFLLCAAKDAFIQNSERIQHNQLTISPISPVAEAEIPLDPSTKDLPTKEKESKLEATDNDEKVLAISVKYEK